MGIILVGLINIVVIVVGAVIVMVLNFVMFDLAVVVVVVVVVGGCYDGGNKLRKSFEYRKAPLGI